MEQPSTWLILLGQVIIVVLLLGLGSFAGIVVLVLDTARSEPFIAYIAAAFALLCAGCAWGAAFFAKQFAAKSVSANEKGDIEQSVGPTIMFLARVILCGVLLEGPGFFNLIAYLLEGQILSLIVVGGLVIGMLMLFPTRSRFQRWLKRLRSTTTQANESR